MKTKLTSWVIATALSISVVAPNANAKMSKAILSDAEGIVISGGGPGSTTVKIEAIEKANKSAPKDVAWLGIATDETCEVLASQLGLKAGEGLVVVYVEPNSPAAKAGLQKFDVLTGMGDQVLVHPGQLRKLVRRQKEGDSIKLEFFRGGKKQSATATLGKMTERTDASETMRMVPYGSGDAMAGATLNGHLSGLHEALSHTGYNPQSANVDLQRSMELARKELHEALMRNGALAVAIAPGATNLQALNLNVGNGTTLTVKKNANSAMSIAKADESGTYVIVANPNKRLTVHDKEGKLIFDGEIETEEQQQKVPSDIWAKAKTMLDEMGPAKQGNGEPEARSTDGSTDEPRT